MWVTGPCSPSSVRKQSRSLLCSPTASAHRRKTPSLRPQRPRQQRQRAIDGRARFLSVHKSPYLREEPTGAAVFCSLERCIEVEGAGRAGEKNRRPTSHYAVQSCAIETVGRTILQTVGAKNGGDRCAIL